MYHYTDLITVFNHCFSVEYNTILFKGDDEPLYLPADEHRAQHTIIFAHGYFASALHECAHWLIAGEARRQLIDFGYWYEPDGRTAEQQAVFQRVEVKPQALEWILSKATGHPFRVSIDNLNGEEADTEAFKLAVFEQVKTFCENGLPKRASIFRNALCQFYGTPFALNINEFNIETL